MVRTRAERPDDVPAIDRIHEVAFGRRAEADLVHALRRDEVDFVSLVAVDAGTVIGHIAFSAAVMEAHPDVRVVALGPMAVLPERQGEGVGSQLVRVGLDVCREREYSAVVVLGHPAYYPRFGFAPAGGYGIRSEYPVPAEVFMVQELREGALAGRAGLVRYARAFGRLGAS